MVLYTYSATVAAPRYKYFLLYTRKDRGGAPCPALAIAYVRKQATTAVATLFHALLVLYTKQKTLLYIVATP